MRILIFLSTFALIVIYYGSVECAEKLDVDGLRNMLKPMSNTCKRRTGVSNELIANTHNGEFPRVRPLMCYFKCLSMMLKTMDKDGITRLEDLQKATALLVREDIEPKMRKVATECFEEVPNKGDPCEYAIEFVECSYKKDKSVYFIPF
ncbi:general odorant-binding protein 83a-like [Copidosoma floridanum]|uniref:general odorant-binding protein 83a-like n=1 Tax=Copidosoma floridanum TaxID=29053 RepID=UPI000C6F686B|nr:general odorant-binding protein 83a-like [Copidosoma floridanum]